MKKILLAALAALSVVCGWTDAHAVAVTAHFKQERVIFRTQVAANPIAQWDSVISQRVGVASSSAPCETTLAIGTDAWLGVPNQALSDTSGFFFKLLVYDAIGEPQAAGGTSESGADSVAVACEVSADGVTWGAVMSFKGGTNGVTKATKNNQTIVDGTYQDQLSINGASLNGGPPLFVFTYKARAVSASHTVDQGSIQGWPYIRFIFKYHMAKGFKLAAKVVHWSSEQ